MGETVVNAGDVNGDGKDDMLVGAPSAAISSDITGRVFLFSNTGALIWQASAPTPQAPNISPSEPTRFGAALARLGDIGSCVAHPSCTVGARDGVSELLVSAPGTDTGGPAGQDEGVVYVLDGHTGQFLKEIRLEDAERPVSGSAGFGKSVASLAGQPPCKGSGGLQPCSASSAVAIGDMSGDGTPDFAVGAPDYTEIGAGETLNCLADVSCPGLGRVYIVRGELITDSAQSALELGSDNASSIMFPATTDGGDPPRFGSALSAVGDLGECAGDPGGGASCIGVPEAVTGQPDGIPDLVASAPGADAGGAGDAGAAFVLDAEGNAAMLRVESTSPQTSGAFGSFLNSFAAPGDLNLDGVPDVLLGAPGEGDGAALMVNGNVTAGAGDRVIRVFTDPAAVSGGRFGASLNTLGDITGDGAGDVVAGAAGGARVGSIHILSACARDVLQTVTDPDTQSEAGFGTAVAPIGDRNGDGMIDLVVGAPAFDGDVGQNQGRAYLLTSDGSVSPVPSGCGGSSSSSGEGNGGGGDEAAPPGDDKKVVIARVLRRLVLRSNRKRVRKNATIRLRGTLSASGNRSVCQNRQKIALQRRKASGGRFQTFEVALTRATGRFTARAIAERTFVYRARVSRTARCMGAVSRTTRVSILRKRGSR